MKKKLPKAYEPAEYEDKIYARWEKSGYFNPDNLDYKKSAKSYSIAMPPPNRTGTLHMGHAVMLAIEDILIRYHRMKGEKTLWVPGSDHAAIATQTKVEKILKKQGLDRHKLGRVEFLKRVRDFAQESHKTIVKQVKKMGCSCDWSREAYTLDEVRSKVVNSVFKMMYDDGLIYRGERVVNWCPRCHSTLADDEVEYREEKGKFYWLKYGPFILATARPETKLGDTAVAVYPNDARYKKMVGKKYMIPGVLGEFEIIVIADKAVDPEFGSGAIKVTPAHSFIDNEMAQRHGVAMKQIINEDGRMMDNCGKYAGLTTIEAREEIVKDMKKMGLIDHIEKNYTHNIAVCYRCGARIEPIPSEQWFIDVNKKIPRYKKSIKELSIEAVKKGVFGKEKIKIVPKRFEKNYFHWLENLRDWCISRQIWFGHQVPVWYKKVKSEKLKVKSKYQEIYVGVEPPEEKTNFIFLHAYGSSANFDFWPWLRERMSDRKIFSPTLHKPYKPNLKEQMDFVLSNSDVNKDTVIAGHSLGCTLAMKMIAEKKLKIKKLILIAPPLQAKKFVDGKIRPVLEKYCDWRFDFKKIKELVEETIVFQDVNDDIVPANDPKTIAKELGAKLIAMEAPVSHFNCDECPEILEELKNDLWRQDEDTLDTWFSSGLWTFSTLAQKPEDIGIKNKKLIINSQDFKDFHPTSVLETGYDILFFWIARMIIMTTYAVGDIPFQDVYLHGLIRDEKGRKMSKSIGNVIDPLDMIKKYGTDATRLSLVIGTTPGNDMSLSEAKVAGYRNFANKLWNIARYIITNYELKIKNYELKNIELTDADNWILEELENVISLVDRKIRNYEFSQAGEILREFTWDKLADWYLEIAKIERNKSKVLYDILKKLLVLWHPFIPFVTEAIWNEIKEKNEDMLIVRSWPKAGLTKKGEYKDGKWGLVKDKINLIIKIVVAIRNARAKNNIEPKKKIKAVIYAGRAQELIQEQAHLIKGLRTGIKELEIKEKGLKIKNEIYITVGEIDIYLIGAIDKAKEKGRIKKEKGNLEKMIKITEKKLANKKFLEKAPKKIVDLETKKLEMRKRELKNLNK